MRCGGGLFWFAGVGKIGHFFACGWDWGSGDGGAEALGRLTKDG